MMPRLTRWMVRTALLYLGVGFTLGGWILTEKGLPTDGLAWRWLPVHIELLIVGWMVQLALGVAFWITPRFAEAPKYGRWRLAWLAYALLNAGVLLAAAGWAGSLSAPVIAGQAVEAAAGLCFAAALWPRIKPLVMEASAPRRTTEN